VRQTIGDWEIEEPCFYLSSDLVAKGNPMEMVTDAPDLKFGGHKAEQV